MQIQHRPSLTSLSLLQQRGQGNGLPGRKPGGQPDHRRHGSGVRRPVRDIVSRPANAQHAHTFIATLLQRGYPGGQNRTNRISIICDQVIKRRFLSDINHDRIRCIPALIRVLSGVIIQAGRHDIHAIPAYRLRRQPEANRHHRKTPLRQRHPQRSQHTLIGRLAFVGQYQ